MNFWLTYIRERPMDKQNNETHIHTCRGENCLIFCDKLVCGEHIHNAYKMCSSHLSKLDLGNFLVSYVLSFITGVCV